MHEYPWFEKIKDSCELSQGDIIKNCPIPMLKYGDSIVTGETFESEIVLVDGIVMTQACDIANNNVENIIICGIVSKEDFEKSLIESGKNSKQRKQAIEGICKGQQNAFHMINNYISEDFIQDYYVINFKQIYSLPLEYAKKLAKDNGTRLRLCPPYREHLSQAFARYFMRVGLPININFTD